MFILCKIPSKAPKEHQNCIWVAEVLMANKKLKPVWVERDETVMYARDDRDHFVLSINSSVTSSVIAKFSNIEVTNYMAQELHNRTFQITV